MNRHMRDNQSIGNACLPNRRPVVTAQVRGSERFPQISGEVNFYAAPNGGTLVAARIDGLPAISLPNGSNQTQVGPFGFHIHEGAACGSPSGSSPYAEAGGHYNPIEQPHPLHAGDLPVLFPNGGRSFMQVYTDRFNPQ